jgi:hypothetical protein
MKIRGHATAERLWIPGPIRLGIAVALVACSASPSRQHTDHPMSQAPHVEQVPAIPLIAVRRRAAQAELSKVVPEACGKVWNIAREQKVPNPGRLVALYLDGQINLEVGVELQTPYTGPLPDEAFASSTPGGRVATIAHFGPYQDLGRAYQTLHQWCLEQGYTPAGPSWEIYGHWQEAWNDKPELIRTDIYVLLR